MKKFIFLLFLPLTSFSQVIGFKEGIGIVKEDYLDVATFSLSYETSLNKHIIQKSEAGFWIDNNETHSSSAYGSYSLGTKVNSGNVFMSFFLGGALINKTDSQLSTNFQFSHDLGVGIEDNGKSIGLNLKHLSNAGIKKPNMGRNFIQLEVKLPF